MRWQAHLMSFCRTLGVREENILWQQLVILGL